MHSRCNQIGPCKDPYKPSLLACKLHSKTSLFIRGVNSVKGYMERSGYRLSEEGVCVCVCVCVQHLERRCSRVDGGLNDQRPSLATHRAGGRVLAGGLPLLFCESCYTPRRRGVGWDSHLTQGDKDTYFMRTTRCLTTKTLYASFILRRWWKTEQSTSPLDHTSEAAITSRSS